MRSRVCTHADSCLWVHLTVNRIIEEKLTVSYSSIWLNRAAKHQRARLLFQSLFWLLFQATKHVLMSTLKSCTHRSHMNVSIHRSHIVMTHPAQTHTHFSKRGECRLSDWHTFSLCFLLCHQAAQMYIIVKAKWASNHTHSATHGFINKLITMLHLLSPSQYVNWNFAFVWSMCLCSRTKKKISKKEREMGEGLTSESKQCYLQATSLCLSLFMYHSKDLLLFSKFPI